ncbi:MAG: hypothetical protein ACRDDJ_07910 [[Mycobacterium] stephanolepidis]
MKHKCVFPAPRTVRPQRHGQGVEPAREGLARHAAELQDLARAATGAGREIA